MGGVDSAAAASFRITPGSGAAAVLDPGVRRGDGVSGVVSGAISEEDRAATPPSPPSFRRKPESNSAAALDPGVRRGDGVSGVISGANSEEDRAVTPPSPPSFRRKPESISAAASSPGVCRGDGVSGSGVEATESRKAIAGYGSFVQSTPATARLPVFKPRARAASWKVARVVGGGWFWSIRRESKGMRNTPHRLPSSQCSASRCSAL